MKPFFAILGWVLLATIIAVAWDARRRAKLHGIFDGLARELGLSWNEGRLTGTIDGTPVTIEAGALLHRVPWLRVEASSQAWDGPAEDAASAVRALLARAQHGR